MTDEPTFVSDIRLERSSGMRDLTDELAGNLERVGVQGVLGRLNRAAEACAVPGHAAVEGFAWSKGDRRNLEWWPQGITWADSPETGGVEGRSVLVASWYAKKGGGRVGKGCRVSFVDYTDPLRPRYRHVLLVEPFRDDESGEVDYRPVQIHAGGIVWFGGYLYVAGTRGGIRVFELEDLIAVPGGVDDRDLIGRQDDGHYTAYGYAFVLPQSFTYTAWATEGFEQLRYSFLSMDRTGDAPHLIAGEYGRDGATTRLTRYAFDDGSKLLSTREDGYAWPRELIADQVDRMQGATLVRGTYVITSSQGRTSRGDMYVGPQGALTRHRGVLPIGPEDITYWSTRRQLWSLTEWPTRRWVYGMDARRWVPGLA
ncbi:MAG: hypothetical protein ACRDO1_19335 [Nocardioidaceae bacterium]